MAAMALSVALMGCQEHAAQDNTVVRPLTVAAVAGCYLFTDSTGRPLQSQSGFWSAPVRLDSSLAFIDGDGADTLDAGIFAVQPTAVIPPEHAVDTAFLRSAWRLRLPDTLIVTRGQRFGGHEIQLRPQGADFIGTERRGGDVAADNARLPALPAVARRVTCPT